MVEVAPQRALLVKTRPKILPASRGDLQRQNRITDEIEGTYADQCIESASMYVSEYLDRTLIETEWVLRLQKWSKRVELPKPPTVSVASVVYIDTDGNGQTLDPAEYTVIVDTEPAYLVAPSTNSFGGWPDVNPDVEFPIDITFTGGYGQLKTDVPMPIRQAIIGHAVHLFEWRGALQVEKLNDNGLSFTRLLSQYRFRGERSVGYP